MLLFSCALEYPGLESQNNQESLFSPKRSDRSWGPLGLPLNGYSCPPLGGKAGGSWIFPLT